MRNQVPDRRGRGPQRQGRNFNENDRRQGRPNNQGDRKFKRHIAKRDHDGRPKGAKGGRDKKADDRDLDRELRDYWIGQKGNKADIDTKEIAREKLDSEMDSYWKQRQEEPKSEGK